MVSEFSRNPLGMTVKKILMALFFITLAFNPLFAAEVRLAKNNRGEEIIEISGEIEVGDLDKVKKTTKELIAKWPNTNPSPLSYHLNTVGGSVSEAIKIGRFFREILASVNSFGKIIIAPGSEDERLFINPGQPWKGYQYVVLSPEKKLGQEHIVANYSAGVLIFYGAVRRAHRDNSDQRLGFYKQVTIPVMGIHRPYYATKDFSKPPPSGSENTYKALEKTVREYLIEMGASQEIIERMFNKPSAEMEMIKAEEFRTFYKPEEPFLEQWLVAKCGATGAENLFNKNDLERYKKIESERTRLSLTAKESINKPFGHTFSSNTFSEEEINTTRSNLYNYTAKVNACRDAAITQHQQAWAYSSQK